MVSRWNIRSEFKINYFERIQYLWQMCNLINLSAIRKSSNYVCKCTVVIQFNFMK